MSNAILHAQEEGASAEAYPSAAATPAAPDAQEAKAAEPELPRAAAAPAYPDARETAAEPAKAKTSGVDWIFLACIVTGMVLVQCVFMLFQPNQPNVLESMEFRTLQKSVAEMRIEISKLETANKQIANSIETLYTGIVKAAKRLDANQMQYQERCAILQTAEKALPGKIDEKISGKIAVMVSTMNGLPAHIAEAITQKVAKNIQMVSINLQEITANLQKQQETHAVRLLEIDTQMAKFRETLKASEAKISEVVQTAANIQASMKPVEEKLDHTKAAVGKYSQELLAPILKMQEELKVEQAALAEEKKTFEAREAELKIQLAQTAQSLKKAQDEAAQERAILLTNAAQEKAALLAKKEGEIKEKDKLIGILIDSAKTNEENLKQQLHTAKLALERERSGRPQAVAEP